MLSGVITPENFPQIFRTIGSKRQNGILELVLTEKKVLVFCFQGKIVDLVQIFNSDSKTEVNSLQEIVKLYELSAQLPQKDYLAGIKSFEELDSRVSTILSPVDKSGSFKIPGVKGVYKAYVFNKLLTLNLQSGGYCNFKAQMVDFNREFGPAISPSQILLGRAELQAELTKLTDWISQPLTVERNDGSLSEEEVLVSKIIGVQKTLEGAMTISLIELPSLLKVFAGLVERGILKAAAEKVPESVVEKSLINEELRVVPEPPRSKAGLKKSPRSFRMALKAFDPDLIIFQLSLVFLFLYLLLPVFSWREIFLLF